MKKLTKKGTLVSTTLIGLLLSGHSINPKNADAAKKGKGEIKCKGVSTKWGNDCGARGHSCAGKAKTHFDSEEWIYLTQKDCDSVKEALKNPAVQSYVESVHDKAVAKTKRMKGKMKRHESSKKHKTM